MDFNGVLSPIGHRNHRLNLTTRASIKITYAVS